MSLVRPLPPPTYVRTLGRILTGKERRLKIGTGRVTRIGTGRVAGTGTGTRTYPWHGRALESTMILIWMRSQLFTIILCLSVYLSVCFFICLSLPPSPYLFASLSISFSICVNFYPSLSLFTCPSPSLCPPLCWSICSSIYLPIVLSHFTCDEHYKSPMLSLSPTFSMTIILSSNFPHIRKV